MIFFNLFQIDKNGDGFIDLSELKAALEGCGFKIPGWKVRQMIEEFESKGSTKSQGRLSFVEFEKVHCTFQEMLVCFLT